MTKIYSKRSDPDFCRSVKDLTENTTDILISTIVKATGLHPVSVASSILSYMVRLLARMDEKGMNLIVEALLSDKLDLAKQEEAMSLLVSGYEQQLAEIQRAMNGGPLQ